MNSSILHALFSLTFLLKLLSPLSHAAHDVDKWPPNIPPPRARIADLDEQDRQRKRREQARNALESFTNDIQSRLYEDIYEQSSTEEEREALRHEAAQMSDWLYEEGFHEPAAVFEQKLEQMRKLTKVRRLPEKWH